MLDDAVHLLESHTGTRGQVWPCQLDAPVVNGLRFFDWVQHYWGMDFHLAQAKDQLPPWAKRYKEHLSKDAKGILVTLGRYAGRDRKGACCSRLMANGWYPATPRRKARPTATTARSNTGALAHGPVSTGRCLRCQLKNW